MNQIQFFRCVAIQSFTFIGNLYKKRFIFDRQKCRQKVFFDDLKIQNKLFTACKSLSCIVFFSDVNRIRLFRISFAKSIVEKNFANNFCLMKNETKYTFNRIKLNKRNKMNTNKN